MMQVAGDILASRGIHHFLGSGRNGMKISGRPSEILPRIRVSIYRGYNEPLAHFIEAGADMFCMMPSNSSRAALIRCTA